MPSVTASCNVEAFRLWSSRSDINLPRLHVFSAMTLGRAACLMGMLMIKGGRLYNTELTVNSQWTVTGAASSKYEKNISVCVIKILNKMIGKCMYIICGFIHFILLKVRDQWEGGWHPLKCPS